MKKYYNEHQIGPYYKKGLKMGIVYNSKIEMIKALKNECIEKIDDLTEQLISKKKACESIEDQINFYKLSLQFIIEREKEETETTLFNYEYINENEN